MTIHHFTDTGPFFAPEYASLTDLPTVQVTVLDDDVPPPAVRGFIAVDESQDAIALSWWSERGAAEYELEYRKQGDTGAWTRVTRGDFDHLPSTTGNRSLTGIATGLECETTYDFRIRLRGSGDILLDAFGPHTEVSRTTGECAQPNKPTNLMYTLDPDCATLTWTAPTGGDYTGVRIRRLTLGDPSFTVIHEDLNSRPTSYRDCTHHRRRLRRRGQSRIRLRDHLHQEGDQIFRQQRGIEGAPLRPEAVRPRGPGPPARHAPERAPDRWTNR